MFHGYPALMQQLQTQMDAKLICIPYFSQTSEEAFVYMTPSLNIAFNKDLEKRSGKAGDCIGCAGLHDFRRGTKTDRQWKMCNLIEYRCSDDDAGYIRFGDEMKSNSIYIRYSAKILSASQEAVHGLLSGEMDEAGI